MKTTKICPHCSAAFEGRNNQLYCSSACKQLAFQLRQSSPMHSPVVAASHSGSDYARQTFKPTGYRVEAVTAKATVEIEKLRLESSEKMRRLELEERLQERKHQQAKEERRHRQALELLERNNQAEAQQWETEQSKLLTRLDELEKQLAPLPPVLPDEKAEATEADRGSAGSGSKAIWGILGAIAITTVTALINSNQPPKKPVLTLDELAKQMKLPTNLQL